MTVLRRLFSASSIYIGASLVTGGLSFALLPLFTRYLTPEDFGVLAIIGATAGILGAVVGLNPQPFFTSKYPDLDERQHRRFAASAVLVAGVTAVTALAVLELLGLAWDVFALPHWVLFGLAGLGMVTVFRSIGLTALKMREEPVPYAVVKVSEAVVAAGIGVLLVVMFGWDWRGKFLGQVLGGIAVAVALVTFLFRSGHLGWRATWKHVKEYVQFSLPVVPHSLAFWAINAQDRYFVLAMSGASAAGIYNVGYSLARVLDVANTGVLTAFTPFFYRRVKDDESKSDIVLMSYGYFLFAAVGCVAFIIVMEYLVPVFVGEDFVQSSRFIPWVAAGYAFNALRNFMTGYLYVEEKTRILATLTVVAAVLNAVLNYLLIRLMGEVGAAVATAATFAVVAIVTTILAVRMHDMPWKEAITGLRRRLRD